MIKYQNGILVDTSVWIDFFNNKYSVHANLLESFIKNNEKIFICPIIYQEILQGIKDDKKFKEIRNIILSFNILNDNIMIITNEAINLYRDLRKKGVTIRKSVDCLIASYSIINDLHLFFIDKDFENISKNTKIKIITT